MKIGIAQVNGVVGDFPGNAKRLLQAYRECLEGGAEVVVSPEMSLVGYPPRDLVFKTRFVDQCLQALDYLASEVGGVPFLVGYVDRNESSPPGKHLRNAAALLAEGGIQARVWKTLLPTYDVFDERRYFEPAERCEPVEWKGRKLGVTICEDIWTEEYLRRPYYERDPVEELVAGGAELILNLSASPFHVGKPAGRRKMIAEVAREHGVPVVYCNSIGANDQLVFDGNSLVIDADGGLRAELASFEEECRVVDLGRAERVEPGPPLDPPEEIWRALVLGLRDYARKTGFSSACLGLSGGIDSALTAAVAAEALGGEHVHGLTLPSPYSRAGA